MRAVAGVFKQSLYVSRRANVRLTRPEVMTGSNTNSLSENRRGLSRFCEAFVAIWDCSLFRDGSRIGSKWLVLIAGGILIPPLCGCVSRDQVNLRDPNPIRVHRKSEIFAQ